MKTTRTYKLNKPDYSDPIDIDELNENFDVIDFALEATQIKKTRVSNTISEKCILPYYRIRNNNDFDVTVTDRNFSVDYVIEAGKSKRFDVSGTNTDINFYVQGLHDVTFEWFIPLQEALEEGGGGTGGTKNYNELINQPKINGVTLTGDVALDTLGIKEAAGKDVDTTGTEVTSASTNVPTSAAVNAFVGSEIAKLGKPMEFKGKFSKAADVPDLSDTKEGWTYKVAVAGTYAGQKAKVGDAFISTGTAWEYFPSGDDEFSGENLLMSEYTKGSAKPESTDVSDTDTLNEAVQKIEWALADKVDKDTTVNGKKLNANIVLSGNDEKLNATSYAKDEEAKDITKDSKIDEAVAQLEYRVDKKVNKTSVSSGENSTTSVINVTDAKAQMAMVAKISGKTYKRNLIDTSETWYKESSSNTVTIKDSTITVTGTWFCAVPVTVKANTTYSISGTIVSGTVNGMIAVLNKDKGDTSLKQLPNIGYNSGTFNTGSNTTVWIAFYGGRSASGTSVYKDVQLEEGSVVNSYVPFGLISTPVESVVSVGKNFFNWNKIKEIYNCRTTTNASAKTITATATGTSNYNVAINCDIPKGTYHIHSSKWISDATIIYNKSGATLANIGASKDATFTLEDDAAYIIFNVQYSAHSSVTFDFSDLQIEKGSTASAYAEYVGKTTVLVPSAVKNLPDYGLGIVQSDGSILANEVDFENGTYVQKVTKKKVKDISSDWGMPNANSYVYCSGLKDKKPGLYNLLMSSFDNHPNAAAAELLNGECKGNATTETIYFMDKSCASIDAFKAKYGETEIVYELNSHKTTPLSDYLRPLPVENGGTLTLVNEHNLDINSVIKYKKEVN